LVKEELRRIARNATLLPVAMLHPHIHNALSEWRRSIAGIGNSHLQQSANSSPVKKRSDHSIKQEVRDGIWRK
jgi:hypothetical protein